VKFLSSKFRGDTLRARLLRGGAWLGSGSFLEQGVRFGRNMLLARLLLPEVLGTMAIVLSAGVAVDSFTEIGVREAIIQNPRGHDPEFMNSAWWISFARALALYLLLFVSAPFIAGFYGNPQLQPLLRLALLSLLFTGANSPAAYTAIKGMRFKRWAAINHGGAIAGVLLTVGLAVWWRNVWALAIGFAAESLFRMLLSYAICPFVPRFPVSRACVREVLGFSRRAVGLPFLSFIFVRADVFVIGKLFAPALLGLYSMSINVAQVPTAFVMNLLSQLLLPTFSGLQADHRRLNDALLRVTSLIACLGAPGVVFAAFSGGQILRLVYGHHGGALRAGHLPGSNQRPQRPDHQRLLRQRYSQPASPRFGHHRRHDGSADLSPDSLAGHRGRSRGGAAGGPGRLRFSDRAHPSTHRLAHRGIFSRAASGGDSRPLRGGGAGWACASGIVAGQSAAAASSHRWLPACLCHAADQADAPHAGSERPGVTSGSVPQQPNFFPRIYADYSDENFGRIRTSQTRPLVSVSGRNLVL